MFEELLTQQNPHWLGDLYSPGVKRSCFRQFLEYSETGQIIAITGVRRAGKSTLIKQYINFLIGEKKVCRNNILFFNLEHPYLSSFREDGSVLQKIYEDYLKMMSPKGKVYLFLDEVQFFRQWPVFVKIHHETKKVDFVVTGSNAAMVSSDMITMLSGRSLALEVFPFSLKELANAQGISENNKLSISSSGVKIRKLFEQLLQYGGFPIVALGKLNETAFDILGSHARTVLLQDVAPRIKARKPADLEKLYVYLLSNISKSFSYLSLSKLLGLADKSIKEYIKAFCEAYLIYEVDFFSYSLKTQMRSSKKVYGVDTGQVNALGFQFTSNKGRLLENLIFIELKRLRCDVYYYKSKKGYEVDFIVKMGREITPLQVSWSLENEDTKQRELRALEETIEELGCDRGIIIVGEASIMQKKFPEHIKVITACEYLMMSSSDQKQVLWQRVSF